MALACIILGLFGDYVFCVLKCHRFVQYLKLLVKLMLSWELMCMHARWKFASHQSGFIPVSYCVWWCHIVPVPKPIHRGYKDTKFGPVPLNTVAVHKEHRNRDNTQIHFYAVYRRWITHLCSIQLLVILSSFWAFVIWYVVLVFWVIFTQGTLEVSGFVYYQCRSCMKLAFVAFLCDAMC